jgi:hypothetical protein
VKQDPLALAIFGAALALLAGLVMYVAFFRAPEPAASAGTSDLLEQARRRAAEIAARFQEKPAPKPAPAPSRATQPAAGSGIEPGHTWRYAVVVEPPTWRDITLTYRSQREADGSLGVLTDFLHAKGKMNFHLGIFAPGHPTHENTRFPGFFMYGAYVKQPLNVGDAVRFGWHWQGKSAASTKRFEGQMNSWEDVTVPAGTFRAALIEGMWTYTEDGEFRSRAYERFWYAPEVSQIVKISREGITPDEGSSRIVAELAEYR